MDKFERLNRQTQEYRNNMIIDRFNVSTKNNYNYFDPSALNNKTFYENNGQYSNHYNYYK